MTKSQTKSLPKLVLSSSRDIPFLQLVLSQKNVRRVKAGLSIEDLADDIYRRTLLQSLNVRAMVDADGNETGMFEVPAGGRRFRALELLVKSKRMSELVTLQLRDFPDRSLSMPSPSMANMSARRVPATDWAARCLSGRAAMCCAPESCS